MPSSLRIYQSSFIGSVIFFVIKHSLIIFLLLSVFMVTLSKSSKDFSALVNNLSMEITKPIFMLIASPVNAYMKIESYLRDMTYLNSENQQLKYDNSKLRAEILALISLEREYTILKELLNYSPNKDISFVVSKIFINNHDTFSKLVIIDHGENDNIKKGQAIITSKGLVGRVIKTNKKHAYILLLNDLNSKIPVYTSDSGEKAIMVGRGSKYPVLEYLGKKHKVTNDEIIYTSGDGLVYPSNIPVGVTSINKNNQIEVIPFVNFNKLQFVKVVL